MAIHLSASQANAMQVTERVASIFSLIGIFFILSTFTLCRGFDKPINRLIFFASFSNLGMNIASLIALDGISAGASSALCQFQAFAIQMFLGVDTFWALCMALNVYLALFRGWTSQRMKRQEWKYFVGCYGASFIPALIYLLVKTKARGRVYGPALLWCWIDSSWDYLRILTLYAVVWLAILAAFVIYCMAFHKVWQSRDELRGIFNPFNEDPFTGVIVTEIEITHQSREAAEAEGPSSDVESQFHHAPEDKETPRDGYSVNVEAPPLPDPERQPSIIPDPFTGVRSWTRNAALQETNPEAWLYARVAFLFFCALLIAWVPSSINRVYSLVRPNSLIYGLNYTETLVLPLQGFWNSLVYIITSQTACRNLWRSMFGRTRVPHKNPSAGSADEMAATVAAGDQILTGPTKKVGGEDTSLSSSSTSPHRLGSYSPDVGRKGSALGFNGKVRHNTTADDTKHSDDDNHHHQTTAFGLSAGHQFNPVPTGGPRVPAHPPLPPLPSSHYPPQQSVGAQVSRDDERQTPQRQLQEDRHHHRDQYRSSSTPGTGSELSVDDTEASEDGADVEASSTVGLTGATTAAATVTPAAAPGTTSSIQHPTLSSSEMPNHISGTSPPVNTPTGTTGKGAAAGLSAKDYHAHLYPAATQHTQERQNRIAAKKTSRR